MLILLIHVDPARHMNRWYAVSVQPSLFDEWAVALTWGSRVSTYQRARLLPMASPDAAAELAAYIIERKRRHGYIPAPSPA